MPTTYVIEGQGDGVKGDPLATLICSYLLLLTLIDSYLLLRIRVEIAKW